MPDININEVVYKWIKGYERIYMIGNNGEVITFVNQYKGCFLKPRLHRTGYYCIELNGKHYSMHRLLAEHFIPNPENKHFINHKDGNKANNSIDNLEWCTASENVKHAYNNGLNIPNPVRNNRENYKRKITTEQKEEIKRRFTNGEHRKQLALEFNVTPDYINQLNRGVKRCQSLE